jgi:prepilin-type N-terminal cleavage/methylation domain-containing protein
MLSKKSYKQAFTLVELSVVIVIISIMLSTVLVSRSLIASAKINKIQEEYRMFNGAINMFSDVYSCLPGDCTTAQMPDINALLPTICGTPPTTVIIGNHYGTVNTGSIESGHKRTCMMLELQAAGYISGLIMATNANEAVLSSSVVNANIPYAKFSRQAAWDYRLVTPVAITATTSLLTIPRANGIGSLASWAGFHQLTLRDSLATSVAGTTTVPIGDITTASTSPATYPLSAVLAQKLDLKFDDGLPYSGNISGGRNFTDSAVATAFTAATAPCTTLITAGSEATAANVTATVAYNNSNNINLGCIVSYIM